ncbi:MAG: cytidine deaminase [Patescibacteria group bacterium]|nr:MAG: cytidine deaminase [Patescibacteria group bacterium]
MTKILFNKLSKQDQNLVNEAEKILKNAYDPYSQFYVGCSLLTKKGNIYRGVNINTCAYGGICAERSAISQMVTAGEYNIKKIAIISKSDYFKVKIHSGPCGICRQLLWEFAELTKEDIKILVSDSDKNKILITSIKKLHPLGFGPRLCFGKYKKYLK